MITSEIRFGWRSARYHGGVDKRGHEKDRDREKERERQRISVSTTTKTTTLASTTVVRSRIRWIQVVPPSMMSGPAGREVFRDLMIIVAIHRSIESTLDTLHAIHKYVCT